MPLPNYTTEPEYGQVQQLEQAQKAAPIQAAQQAAPPPIPAAPQSPGGSAAGQIDEEEFLSPFAAANLTYEQSVALFNQQVAANMAVDERSHPDMKELYWALKQDMEELIGGKDGTQNKSNDTQSKSKEKDTQKSKE